MNYEYKKSSDLLELLLHNDVRSSKIGKHLAGKAISNPSILGEIIQYIEHEKKKVRAAVAETFAETSHENVKLVKDYAHQLLRGLQFKEPQTRWECLVTLDNIVKEYPEQIEDINLIIKQLDEPKSMIVRSVAVTFLGSWADGNNTRQEKVMPILFDQLDKKGWENEGKDIVESIIKIADTKDNKFQKDVLEILLPYKKHKRKKTVKLIEQFERKIEME